MVRKVTEATKAYKKAWYQKNKEKKKTSDRARYLAKKEEILNRAKEYYLNNKDAKSEYDKKYQQKNAEKITARRKIYFKKYKELNRGYLALKNRRRKNELKNNQTPLWSNLNAINIIYRQAKRKSNIEGRQYHVDHIIPLNGKFVSGLHVVENLQIILAKENLAKGNKYDNP